MEILYAELTQTISAALHSCYPHILTREAFIQKVEEVMMKGLFPPINAILIAPSNKPKVNI